MPRRRRAVDVGGYPLEGKEFATPMGWCIDGDHPRCPTRFVSSLTRADYLCTCPCHKDAK